MRGSKLTRRGLLGALLATSGAVAAQGFRPGRSPLVRAGFTFLSGIVPILDTLIVAPLFALDVDVLRSAHIGPTWKVKRTSDAVTQAGRGVAELAGFLGGGAGTFVSLYDQAPGANAGTEWPVAGSIPVAFYGNGTVALAKASATTSQYIAVPAAYQAAMGSTSAGLGAFSIGCTIADAGRGASGNLFLMNGGTGQPRVQLAISNSAVSLNSRRLDGDTTRSVICGNAWQAQCLLATVDYSAPSARGWTFGEQVGFGVDPTYGAGATSATAPSGNGVASSVPVGFDAPSGVAIGGLFGWPTALSAIDRAAMLAWMSAREAKLLYLNTYLADAINSWWEVTPYTYDAAVKRLVMAYSTRTGVPCLSEFDATTPTAPFMVANRRVNAGEWPADDHLSETLRSRANGSRSFRFTGHGTTAATDKNENSGSVNNHSYYAAESPTGRLADMGPLVPIPNTIGRSNYQQLFEDSTGVLHDLTNDDAAAGWLFLGRRGLVQINQSETNEGGSGSGYQTQYYMHAAQIGDTLQCFSVLHPSNGRNRLRVSTYNLLTGDYRTGASAETLLGNDRSGTGYIANSAALSVFFDPGAGKSIRLMRVSEDGNRILVARWDTPTSGSQNTPSARTIEYLAFIYSGSGSRSDPANYTMSTVYANAGDFLGITYPGGFCEGVETAGLRFYASSYDSAATNWKLLRLDSTDGGATYTSTVVFTSTGSADKVIRPLPIRNGIAGLSVVYFNGTWTGYNTFNTRSYFA